jgi:DNA polymerase III alpha subunit
MQNGYTQSLRKVVSKKIIPYKGKVHDLTVMNSHSYTVENKAVHNSGAGSLVNYLLGITHVDPLKYDLLWERFMGRHRCLDPLTLVKMSDGTNKPVGNVNVGDVVVSGNNRPQKIKSKFVTKHKKLMRLTIGDQTITCSPNHRWIVLRDGLEIEVLASEIQPTDLIRKLIFKISKASIMMEQNHSFNYAPVTNIEVLDLDDDVELIDIEVENDHTFFVSQDGDEFILTHNSGYPDIDTDVGDREKLIDAAREIFGNDAVVPVSNFNTLKLKSLVKDVSKFYGVPFDEVNAMTGPLEREVENKSRDPNMEKSMFVLKHEDCMEHSENYRNFMTKYPHVEEKIRTLFMMNRSVGRHAGGVLICPNLEQHMPLITVRGELQTPWTEGVNIRNLEENGFLKFDFLGIKQMKMVEDCIARILKRELGRDLQFEEIKKFYDDKLNCRYVEPNDDAVFEHVYRNNRWPGIFQFTSDGARKFCHEVQPTSIEDIGVVTAIYRPGPLKANVHKKYVEAKRDASKAQYEHPTIKDVLGTTYGFIAFQEQFMMLAQKLAGFSPGESDKMRKTLVKKDLTSLGKKSEEKEALEKKFIDGCISVSGMNSHKAKELFDKIAFFSLYGFNKSHAIAYAIDSYYGAWLMTYYETDWLATCLQSENSDVEGLAWMISEIKRLGYKVSLPDINHSTNEWSWSDSLNAFVPPLSSLKGVGGSAVEEIIANRPYSSIEDMLWNADGTWRHSKFNKKAIDALIKMEAFSSMHDPATSGWSNYRQLHHVVVENMDQIKKSTKKDPFVGKKRFTELLVEVTDMADWTRLEKIENKMSCSGTLDITLCAEPEVLQRLQDKNVKTLDEIDGTDIYWFIVKNSIPKTTKNGKAYLLLEALAPSGKVSKIFCWKWDGERQVKPYTLCIAEVAKSDFGMSTSFWKLKEIAQ